jgi:hypothetical protein
MGSAICPILIRTLCLDFYSYYALVRLQAHIIFLIVTSFLGHVPRNGIY